MESPLNAYRRTARLAALLFISVCFPAASWGLSYIPSKIFVSKDATATATNLLSYEFLFRTSIISHLVSTLAFVGMTLLFYRIFRAEDKQRSWMIVAPVLAQVPIVLVLELFRLTALMILKGGALMTLPMALKQEFAYLLLRMHGYGIALSQLLWGLFFLLFGLLAYRCRFIPTGIGVLLLISGFGYVADTAAFVLLQRPDYLAAWPFIRTTFLGGALSMLWFLLKGVQGQAANEQPIKN